MVAVLEASWKGGIKTVLTASQRHKIIIIINSESALQVAQMSGSVIDVRFFKQDVGGLTN